MVEKYSLKDKAKVTMGYILTGTTLVGFLYLYANTTTEEHKDCRFVSMSPAILVCEDKTIDQRISPHSQNIDKIVTE